MLVDVEEDVDVVVDDVVDVLVVDVVVDVLVVAKYRYRETKVIHEVVISL